MIAAQVVECRTAILNDPSSHLFGKLALSSSVNYPPYVNLKNCCFLDVASKTQSYRKYFRKSYRNVFWKKFEYFKIHIFSIKNTQNKHDIQNDKNTSKANESHPWIWYLYNLAKKFGWNPFRTSNFSINDHDRDLVLDPFRSWSPTLT